MPCEQDECGCLENWALGMGHWAWDIDFHTHCQWLLVFSYFTMDYGLLTVDNLNERSVALS
jgi:hypothetical protein